MLESAAVAVIAWQSHAIPLLDGTPDRGGGPSRVTAREADVNRASITSVRAALAVPPTDPRQRNVLHAALAHCNSLLSPRARSGRAPTSLRSGRAPRGFSYRELRAPLFQLKLFPFGKARVILQP